MYTSCLQREILFSSINVHLNTLRENVSLHIEYPQDQYMNNINKEIDSIYEELDQFKSLEFSGDNEEMNKIIDQQFLALKNRGNSRRCIGRRSRHRSWCSRARPARGGSFRH